MYKVYFEESFFEWLDDFLFSMKKFYSYFYSNTWIEDEEKIVQSYFNIYDNLKTEILSKINLISQDWIIWRRNILKNWDIENCMFSFVIKSYKITFSAFRNEIKNEIIVYNLKIEV